MRESNGGAPSPDVSTRDRVVSKRVTQVTGQQSSERYAEFRLSLAKLHLLSRDELERRWSQVQEKNESKIARGMNVNPYHRQKTS